MTREDAVVREGLVSLFHSGQNCGCDKCAVVRARIAALDALVAEVDRLIAERQRLTDENDKAVRALWDEKNKFMEALEAEQRDKGFALAEVERLGVLLSETEGERVGWKDRAEAAEADAEVRKRLYEASVKDRARLREALRKWESVSPHHRGECLFLTVGADGCTCGLQAARDMTRAALGDDA